MNMKLLPVACLLLATPALFAQDYEIRLNRALKAGDELKISVTAKMSQSTTQAVNGAAAQEQKQEITVQFDGTEKAVEVDATGRETKETLTVDKFTQTVGGATTDVAPKGTVITCSVVDNKPSFQIDGKDVDASIAMPVGMVAELSHGDPTNDDLFGAKEHKKKGDSWDMNADLAKKSFADSAGGIEISELSGKTTLDDVSGDTMKISSTITGKVKPPLPPSVTVDDASMSATLKGTYPVDVTKYIQDFFQEMTISFSAHAEGPGGKVVIKSTVVQSETRTSTPLK